MNLRPLCRGDWLLSNGHLCAVISGREHQAYLSPYGGVLVDLWHCEQGNDQWVTLHQQYNMDKQKIPAVESIEPVLTDRFAEIVVSATLDGIRLVTGFHLDLESPNTLTLKTTLRREGEGDDLEMFGTLVLHPRGTLSPFTLDTQEREFSIGFEQPELDTSKRTEMLASINSADLQVLVGDWRTGTDISYGLKMDKATLADTKGRVHPLKQFLIGGDTFSLLGLEEQLFQ